MARPRLRLPEHDIAQAYLAGASINHLAQQHGVDRDVVRRILNDHQIPRTPRPGGTPKLTPAQVLQLRADHTTGDSYRTLATRYGITPTAAAKIIRRQTWKHMP